MRHGRLEGYAQDVVEIIEALDLPPPVVLVGHSVSAMIGVLVAAERPELVHRLVLVGPNPRYVDDDDYPGAFTTTFLSDNRADLPRVHTPALILKSR